jgi:flagellar M-ring protein FliF
VPEQIQTIIENLKGFGTKRLALMGAMAAVIMATIVVGSIYLNRPAYETLYVGLERQDVSQIGMVLGEAGIAFDVGSDGTSVLVASGNTARARMLLAEKGLPNSANAGYELFDNVGSLGLTSFMQQITRVRALEGEIARSIQSLAGIKAARVHIVMSERANFRREEQQPSASVVIRYAGTDGSKTARSIRHLVAAAVPGLGAEKVTVLDSTGNLLAAGDDPSNTSAVRSLGVEQTVETQIEDNIRRALTPYLGTDNFRASVKANARGAFGSERSQQRSEQPAPDRFADQRRAEPARNAGGQLRRAAVQLAERPARGNHQLRDQFAPRRHHLERLYGGPHVGRRGRQPAPAAVDSRRKCNAAAV